ncbi:MAG: hypothetical protein LBM99_02000, partial [Bacillales bacterium]|nr:hypothetical protein [Bacillales bacterium]
MDADNKEKRTRKTPVSQKGSLEIEKVNEEVSDFQIKNTSVELENTEVKKKTTKVKIEPEPEIVEPIEEPVEVEKRTIVGEIERVNADVTQGLSEQQVFQRLNSTDPKISYVNTVKEKSGRSYFSIIASKVFTGFNLICVLIAILIIILVEPENVLGNLMFL